MRSRLQGKAGVEPLGKSTEHFEQFVKTGEPLDFHATMTPEQWQIYQRGQRDHARLAADEVARRTRVPRGATAMLDVGGAHGLFSVALCRKHPGLRATVLDLAPAVEASAPLLAEEGLGARVVHRVGDALTDDLGEDAYDMRGSCGFSFGSGCSGGTSEPNLFGTPKRAKTPMEVM